MVFEEKYSRKKPFLVEFAGPPKSGKTTIIDRIKYELPYTFSIIREVSIDAPVEKKKTLKYMEWAANELINKLIFTEELIKKQIVLIDCGILSQLSLLEAFKSSGKIKDSEMNFYEQIRNHLLLNLKRENLIFYVSMTPQKEVDRIRTYNFPKGAIMNERFLRIFNQSYEDLVKQIKGKIRIFNIDGSFDPDINAKIPGRDKLCH